MTIKTSWLMLCCAVAVVGCNRGFQSANDLEKEERGPKQCSASCKSIGMKMAAFVLVEHTTSGCVCAPLDEGQSPEKTSRAAAGEAAAVAGAHIILEQQRQEAHRQRPTYSSRLH